MLPTTLPTPPQGIPLTTSLISPTMISPSLISPTLMPQTLISPLMRTQSTSSLSPPPKKRLLHQHAVVQELLSATQPSRRQRRTVETSPLNEETQPKPKELSQQPIVLCLSNGATLSIPPGSLLYRTCGLFVIARSPNLFTTFSSLKLESLELCMYKVLSLLPSEPSCPRLRHSLEEIPILRLLEEPPPSCCLL